MYTVCAEVAQTDTRKRETPHKAHKGRQGLWMGPALGGEGGPGTQVLSVGGRTSAVREHLGRPPVPVTVTNTAFGIHPTDTTRVRKSPVNADRGASYAITDRSNNREHLGRSPVPVINTAFGNSSYGYNPSKKKSCEC